MDESLRNLKMIIAYEGTAYAGFQFQKNGPSIQRELQTVIQRITGENVNVHGAGRTDAGVHANGQVIHFHTHTMIPTPKLQKAINALLPTNIVIKTASEVPAEFHSRYDAISKTYIYRIHNSEERPIFNRKFVYHYRRQLNIGKMREAIALLVGEHDFKSFQACGSTVKTTIRTINFCSLESTSSELALIINANGFLYHMVRNIMGTLIMIGQDKIDLPGFQKIILAKDRALAGETAPAIGLCLEEVLYPGDN
jgi:tRNA pseudouridine38-40 synthase